MVEVGGGLSGLQFVPAAEGAHVVDVDPGGAGYTVDAAALEVANDLFRADVELRPTTLAEAGVADRSADAVVSVSTLEHLDPAEVGSVLREARRILRPGGRLVLTVDLFLDPGSTTARCSRTWRTTSSGTPARCSPNSSWPPRASPPERRPEGPPRAFRRSLNG